MLHKNPLIKPGKISVHKSNNYSFRIKLPEAPKKNISLLLCYKLTVYVTSYFRIQNHLIKLYSNFKAVFPAVRERLPAIIAIGILSKYHLSNTAQTFIYFLIK